MDNPPSKMGPYRIVRLLGEGGMGVVFEALHEAIERRVAIKVLHAQYAHEAEFSRRFINEARAVNRIAHPGLVQVSDFGQQPDGATYIVMEFLEGESLAARLKRMGGRLPIPEVVNLGGQLADSLAAAHAKGIIHRDLKPHNVMIVLDPQTQGGERTKLLDFGIAKVAESEAPSGVRTRTNQLMGTPTYMSPEQCEGAGTVDAKSDVYALGVMLFEMLVGRPPFIADGVGKILGMHILVPPPLLSELAPEVPPALGKLVQRLLSKSRQERPTMRQLADALAQLAEQFPLRKRTSSELDAGTDADPNGNTFTAFDATQASGPDGIGARAQSGTSTLGFSAAQALRSRPDILRTGVVLGSAAFTLSAVLFIALVHRPGLRTSMPPSAQDTQQLLSANAPPASFTWRVASVPAGAELIRLDDGRVVGTTPWETTQPAGQPPLRLRLHLNGYRDQEVLLNEASKPETSVSLVSLEPSVALAQPQDAALDKSLKASRTPMPGEGSGNLKTLRTQRSRRLYAKPPMEK